MKKLFFAFVSAAVLASTGAALAATDYNKPPAGDSQYAACIKASNENYTGGNDKSLIKGQTMAQAYCTCVWNETPEDFKGSLARFAETAKGKSTKALCEKHSGWES